MKLVMPHHVQAVAKSALLAVIASLVLAPGCKSPSFGGASYKVELASNPKGAVLYLIKKSEWNHIADWETRDLRQFKLTDDDDGLSPMTKKIAGYQYVLVAEHEGKRDYVIIRATREGETFVVPLSSKP